MVVGSQVVNQTRVHATAAEQDMTRTTSFSTQRSTYHKIRLDDDTQLTSPIERSEEAEERRGQRGQSPT